MGFSTIQIDTGTAIRRARKMNCFEASSVDFIRGLIPWHKVNRADQGDNGKLYLTFAGVYPFPFATFE